jgi:L-asparaginase/Glu-tRNA(Gln) amidotransferase subunit D
VLCVINDKIHYAVEITKTNTVHLEPMRSPNRGLAGFVDDEIVTWFLMQWQYGVMLRLTANIDTPFSFRFSTPSRLFLGLRLYRTERTY